MRQENLAGRTIAGYRLLERVGEGGTATVYRAEHPQHGKCAVKILKERLRKDPTAVKRFLREAGYGARVQHPHVVRTFDYGEEDELDYLALEWAEGEPLADYIEQRDGSIPPAEVSLIINQLADALSAAHAAGIIHRDLKPENIIYDPNARSAKLLDFGIARDSQLDANERLTRAGFFVGSVQYVPPEALSGALVGEAADTYSLATIAYYLLTHRHPYPGNSPRELFQQLLTGTPVALNQASAYHKFPAALERAIMKGLSREPTARQASVHVLAEDIGKAVAGIGSEPEGSKFMGRLRRLFGGGSDA